MKSSPATGGTPARLVSRARVLTELGDQLALALIEGDIAEGDQVTVDAAGDELKLS